MQNPAELKPRRNPRQSRSRFTVDAILESAALILKESGFEALTCNAVVERAGVSIGSLYQYFPGKEALVAELRRRHFSDVSSTILRSVEESSGKTFQEQLRAAIAANVDVHMVDPKLHYLLTERYRDVGYDPDTVEPRNDPALLFEEAAARALMKAYGFSRSTAKNSAAAVFTIVESLTHAALIQGSLSLAHDALIDEICDAAIGYLEKRAAR